MNTKYSGIYMYYIQSLFLLKYLLTTNNYFHQIYYEDKEKTTLHQISPSCTLLEALQNKWQVHDYWQGIVLLLRILSIENKIQDFQTLILG